MDNLDFKKLPKEIQQTIDRKLQKDSDLINLEEAFNFLKQIETINGIKTDSK